jgi:predicted transcriptional regulator
VQAASDIVMPGKRIKLDDATWQALDVLARDSMKDFQELADEAFADLLKKHGRPVTLTDALRQSARQVPANDPGQKRRR